MRRALSAAAVARLREPGRYAVGDGAYLQISQWGTKAWVLRYVLDGKSHYMGLGSCALVTLAEARSKARDGRRLLLDGVDPIAARRTARHKNLLNSSKLKTFKECAEAYIAAHEKSWRNRKSHTQWVSSLEQYVYPKIGQLSVADIDDGLVLEILEPIWTRIPETAGRVRGRVENILAWARVRKLREGDNPARWRGHLDHVLPALSKLRRVKHHAALLFGRGVVGKQNYIEDLLAKDWFAEVSAEVCKIELAPDLQKYTTDNLLDLAYTIEAEPRSWSRR
jgi:Arm DNA-binding domain